MRRRILVIRLSALGDLVMAIPAFQTLRRHHRTDHITLMTTAPYADFFRTSPFFDDVIVDQRPKWKDPLGWIRLARTLRGPGYDRVYDLQNADRTGLYLRLLKRPGGPLTSGTSRHATMRWSHPDRFALSIAERHQAQLVQAGVIASGPPPLPDLSWVTEPDAAAERPGRGLPEPFALLIPGASKHRSVKRWPTDRYAMLAADLAEHGITPVVLGTRLEQDAAAMIGRTVPAAVDLTGRTDFTDLVLLGRRARVAIGGDTGPVHLIAAAGAPTLALISAQTNPSCLPRGPAVHLIKHDDMNDLRFDDVRQRLRSITKN